MLTLADVAAPKHTIRSFKGPEDTISTMTEMVRGPRGERSMVVYAATQAVIRGLQPKDYLSEILAIRNFVAEKCRYCNDPASTELVRDPQHIIEEIAKHGRISADCDDIACVTAAMARQVGRDAEFITVGFGEPGRFTHVFCRVLEPKSGKWIVCDPVAGTGEEKMLLRVKTWKAHKIP
jgi:transglutaminase-like putative cysteine protease